LLYSHRQIFKTLGEMTDVDQIINLSDLGDSRIRMWINPKI